MSLFTQLYNSITHSRLWYSLSEFKYKMGFKYIHWLLKRNGIDAPSDKDVLWHYLLGQLTEEAFEKGIAVKHLYIINNRFLKIRGFTLLSVTHDTHAIRNLTTLNARDAYELLGSLLQLPVISKSSWTPETQEEKRHLIKNLEENAYQFWREIKRSCKRLSTNWKLENSFSQNIGMQSFSIISAVLFSVKMLPDAIFPVIEEFETIWGTSQQLDASRLRENLAKFDALSIDLHQQRQNQSLPANDLLHQTFRSHQSRSFHIQSPEQINIAAYLVLFENLPKSLVGLFTLVFSDERWVEILQHERERLHNELNQLQLSPKSQEGFQYILNHSEVFDRFYLEVLRLWPVAPVIPRVNSNLFCNRILGWGEDMNITENVELPPRSIGILPQYQLSNASKSWSNPTEFNPLRSEYNFKQNQNGNSISTGQRPLAQGPMDSFRGCPAKKMVRSYFYGMLYWLPQYNSVTLSQKEKENLLHPLESDSFYRTLTPSHAQDVRGSVSKKSL